MGIFQDSSRFLFGENWRDYSALIDEERLAFATDDLLRLVGPLERKSFLDIGSGSGLHSLAAWNLGADVTAIDIDAQSVATTRDVLAHTTADVRLGSVFDWVGQYDVVYSWGVLHHTGDMWAAIRRAVDCVMPGGVLAVALYRKTTLCRFWAWEKWAYVNSPRWLQRALVGAFGSANLAGRCIKRRQMPRTVIAAYSDKRGMSFWHDIHDWLGGYPYESVRPAALITAMKRSGFSLEYSANTRRRIGLLGTGCSEFRFRRTSPANC